MIVSPSLLSADFYNLQRDIRMINRSAATWLHLDIMDGSFVPNISFGFPVIKAIGKRCKRPLDAHFMIVSPERYVKRAAEHGIMIMTVHVEACNDVNTVVETIHAHGMKAGISLKPDTPLSAVENVLCQADMFLVMGVNPGYSGQQLIAVTAEKVRTLISVLLEDNSRALIEVDGGVNRENARLLASAGADALVSGDYIFKAQDPITVIEELSLLK